MNLVLVSISGIFILNHLLNNNSARDISVIECGVERYINRNINSSSRQFFFSAYNIFNLFRIFLFCLSISPFTCGQYGAVCAILTPSLFNHSFNPSSVNCCPLSLTIVLDRPRPTNISNNSFFIIADILFKIVNSIYRL